MLARLTPVGGGVPIILIKKKVTLGRDPENDHAIPCRSVSGKHCELELVDGYWWVRDSGSRNGISVDNVRCQTSRIPPGGVLRMANQRFRLDYKAPKVESSDDIAMSFLTESASASSAADERITPAASGPTSGRQASERSIRQRSHSSHTDFTANAAVKTTRRYLGKLVPCGGGDPIALLESPLIVGRRSQCDITLKFADVSSRHCTLTYEDGFWVVDDAGSRNGIRVNGERVERKVLYPEDRISLASHRFTIHYTPEGSLPPADENTFSKSLLEKIGMKDQSYPGQKRIPGAGSESEQSKRIVLE